MRYRAEVITTRMFDRIETLWEAPRMRHAVAAALVVSFLAAVIAIDLNRRGLLPARVGAGVPRNHFRAVELAFWLLLAYEVVGLVLGIARSVANAAGKQFEIFSLILLRHSFEEFGYLDEPLVWEGARDAAFRMVANGFGALLVFVVLGFYYALQRHRPITEDQRDNQHFIDAKKAIALVLLVIFAIVSVSAVKDEGKGLFETFFTVLVFADILVVLISLRFSGSYHVVFRNSGLALATVLLRVALSAPPYYNAGLGLAAALFALGLTLAFNRFAPVLHPAGERGDLASAA